MLTPAEQKKRDELKAHKPLVWEKVMRYDERYARGESIAVIQFQYDYRCNMLCVHCSISVFRKEQGRRSMTPESTKDLFDQADAYGLAQVDLTGGEPLLFPDLEEMIRAIGPDRFYLMVDSNGWLMTPDKAKYLKSLGVDKVQIGLDNMDAAEHDAFRKAPGSHERALRALDAVREAGLVLQVSTVITPARVRSQEFDEFLAFCGEKGATVNSIWAKPVGEYALREDLIVSPEDERIRMELCGKHFCLTPPHPTKHFGLDMGCIAAKKIVTITKFGDVMPCIWIYYSLGNVFEEPLRAILARGMRHFRKYHGVCRTSQDRRFIREYAEATKGRELPIRIEEVMGEKEEVGMKN